MTDRQVASVPASDSMFAEQEPAWQYRRSAQLVSRVELVVVQSSSAEAERPVPEHSDCQAVAELLSAVQVADTGMAERLAAEASAVAGTVVGLASADKSVGTEAASA